MDSTKYIGMDVHKDATAIAVMNSAGKVVMESILETKAATILQFVRGLRGNLLVTFEEGTWAAWLYDLLKPYVTQVTVCNPRKNALLKSGNKGDRIDAQKLAELLRHGSLASVYHGEKGFRTLKELSRSYLTLSKDLTRVMNRLKALYHSWGIACSGTRVYAPRHRAEWLSKISEAGVRRRAEFTYQQLDGLQGLRQAVRRDLLAESRKQTATKLLRQIPGIGPIRAALKAVALRGLNKNHNHDLKSIFKSTSVRASSAAGPLREFYESLLAKGMKPSMARLTLARKIAAITLIVWKKGVRFDGEQLKPQAA